MPAWHLALGFCSARLEVCLRWSSWFGRFGVLGFDIETFRVWAVCVCMAMVFGRVWRGGNGPRLHSQHSAYNTIMTTTNGLGKAKLGHAHGRRADFPGFVLPFCFPSIFDSLPMGFSKQLILFPGFGPSPWGPLTTFGPLADFELAS